MSAFVQLDQLGTADFIMLYPHLQVFSAVFISQRNCGPDRSEPGSGECDLFKPIYRRFRLRTCKQLLMTEIITELRPVSFCQFDQFIDIFSCQSIREVSSISSYIEGQWLLP